MTARRIGALLFPGFELLDVYGPLEMFGLYPEHFAITMVAEESGAIASGQGVRGVADIGLSDAGAFDLLLVPGGMGTRREIGNARLIDWIAEAAARAEIVTSVCTGAALLATTGCLDGRSATTNKNAFDWVAAQRPAVKWQRQARWVEDGKYVTSSGVSAGMDMALAVIGRLLGDDHAVQAARWAEYTRHEDPAADPFCQPPHD